MATSDRTCLDQGTMAARLHRAAALGELTAALAHELNNVHMVATGNIELLLGADGQPESRALGKCRDAVWRGAEILRALLALAVVDENGRRPGLASVFREVRSLLASRLTKHRVAIDAEDLDDAPLAIDAVILGLVLYGLLVRLVEAPTCRRISLQSLVEGGQLIGTIAADLPSDQCGELFAGSGGDPHRLGTVDTQATRQLLVAAGGSLELESVGGRATVVMRLPLA